jgi:hypothetical protein
LGASRSTFSVVPGIAIATLAACGKPAAPPPPPDAAPPPAAVAPKRVEEALAAIVATCSKLHGDVEVRRRGEAFWTKATLGATLRQGDWVRTGPKSTVRLQLLGQGSLDLTPESTVLIDIDPKPGAKQTVLVRLEQGSARGETPGTTATAAPIVIQGMDGSRAELRAEADGKPMQFRLTGRSSGPTELAVLQGSARVAAGQGEVVLQGGSAIDVSPKAEVVQLLAFPRSIRPGADARFQFSRGASIRLEWAVVPGAAGYVVEIARDLSFEDVVSSSAVTVPRFAFEPSDQGMYAWRVAARDPNGRLSEFGFVRRLFSEKEIPRDLLLAPRDATHLAYELESPHITFSWQPVGDARGYRLVISHGDLNVNPVFDETTTAPKLVVSTLTDGAYKWGVYALRDETESPIFLAPRTLDIRRKEAPRARTDGLWREEDKK